MQASSGPETGGTSVTISGAGFEGALEVRFGGTAVPFTPVSQGVITASSPPGAGAVDVTVTGPGGTSRLGSADEFSYLVTGPYRGIPFYAGLPYGAGVQIPVGAGSSAFSFGPLPALGAPGETASVELRTPEPAFREPTPEHYSTTGGGVQGEVEGQNAAGEGLLGPLPIACSVPARVVLARIPVKATLTGEEPTTATYTANYEADCVLGPGVLDSRQTATISISATGPAAVTPGQLVTVTGASFSITAPAEWTQQLRAIGVTAVRGSATSDATMAVVG